MKARTHALNERRLQALRELEILDTPRESDFDEIVLLASKICETPISVVNLIDEHRQWFKAETGLGVRETPLDTSICAHVILEPGLTIVPDTLQDQRFADNPLCLDDPSLRFYAGAVLETDEGLPIGTLCVLDTKPRDLTDLQRFSLAILAKQVMTQVKLRMLARQQAARVKLLEEAVANAEILTREVDHRVKNSFGMVAAVLNLQSKSARTEDAAHQLTTARDRVLAMATLHDQLQISTKLSSVDMVAFVSDLAANLEKAAGGISLAVDVEPMILDTQIASATGLAINELVTNSIKHAFPIDAPGEISIRLARAGSKLQLSVSDNGRGGAEKAAMGRKESLGSRIIRSSVEQLGGSVGYAENAPGLHVQIEIPLNQ